MNPTWPYQAFPKKVVNDKNCHVSIFVIARAKRKALEKIYGNHVEQYEKLWDHGNELLKVIPDNTILIMTDDEELADGRKRFKRIYTCFGPLKKWFTGGCRPLVGLVGCHLKGPYERKLLAAIEIYANDDMYLIAWDVVEAENSDSWNWFLKNLRDDLNIENDGGWTSIPDRKKVIMSCHYH